VKDLPKVHTWRLEVAPKATNTTTQPRLTNSDPLVTGPSLPWTIIWTVHLILRNALEYLGALRLAVERGFKSLEMTIAITRVQDIVLQSNKRKQCANSEIIERRFAVAKLC